MRRLSGGNQQKLTIGRWLATGFKVLLCFDPTRGIDIQTKAQIYRLLRELADEGAAILLYTSELREIPLVCDRVLVMYAGRWSTSRTRPSPPRRACCPQPTGSRGGGVTTSRHR